VTKRRIDQIQGIIPDDNEIESEIIETSAPDKEKNPLDLEIEITKRNGLNKTFYLDKEIVQKLSKTAKKMGVSESKLINEILRKVL